MYHAFSYHEVPVYIHWSACVILAWALLAGIVVAPGLILVAAGYLVLMAIHELGHLEMARRRGRRAVRIEMYPWIGFCYVEVPDGSRDDLEIAWGGVLAQLPFLILAFALEPLRDVVPQIGAVSFVFGFLNLTLIVFNLVPMAPLDGHKAWRLVPLLLRR